MISNIKLKKFLQNRIFPILSFVNQKINHNSQIILLYSNLGFRDNIRALFNYIIESGLNNKYRIVCSLNDHQKYNNLVQKNVKIISNSSGIKWYFRAGYVFYCFGKIPIIPGKNQRVGQMWHGVCFKSGDKGMLDGHQLNKQYYTDFFSTSRFLDAIWSKLFSLNPQTIKISGQPRNDALFSKGIHYNFGLYSKLILWLPTFRKSNLMGYEDVKAAPLIPIISIDKFEKFNQFLKERNVKIIIKLHPMQDLEQYSLTNFENFILLSNEDFVKRNLDLYKLMAQCDAMITDYSSVFFDYLLLNRPIGFTIDDMDEYIKNRGFNFENPYMYMPGAHIKNIDGLYSFVDNLVYGIDDYISERKRVNDLFNEYQDNHSAQRVLETMGIKR